MALSKSFLTAEIDKSIIAIKTIKEGLAVNELILQAFEEALANATE